MLLSAGKERQKLFINAGFKIVLSSFFLVFCYTAPDLYLLFLWGLVSCYYNIKKRIVSLLNNFVYFNLIASAFRSLGTMKLFVVEEMLLCLMMLFLLPAERPHLSK
jgi:hypothetical protein